MDRPDPGQGLERALTVRSQCSQTVLAIGRGTLRKMRQNLGWAVGYNAIALPMAAGVFEPAFGLVLRPQGSSIAGGAPIPALVG